jgi:UDP-glucose 4-epimerase
MVKARNILVVGGAGYIGSHMVKLLLDRGQTAFILDDLSTGHADAIVGGTFVKGSLADRSLLKDVLRRHPIDAVMHFASCIEVGESVLDPGKYYRNNVAHTVNLLDSMVEAGVRRFIFSSSAAVYGDPQRVPLAEDHPTTPVNPYGRSKLMVEQMLEDYDRAHGVKSVSLRYFNAAGADPSGRLGERHEPESHLIPRVLQSASGRRNGVAVFGADYDTPDGTCIRDYIHVIDLCEAHLAGLDHLASTGTSVRINLGNGNGFSVREVIETARRVTGREFAVSQEKRRAGDAPRLVADAALARKLLGWKPRYPELQTIIEHAWRWELEMAKGKR